MLYSPEVRSPQEEAWKQEEDENAEIETLSEQKEERKNDDEDDADGDDNECREEDYEVEEVELDDTTKPKDEPGEHFDHQQCLSLDLRASEDEKSHDLTPSPRPLSQESRNLTASELLLNKSVLPLNPIPI